MVIILVDAAYLNEATPNVCQNNAQIAVCMVVNSQLLKWHQYNFGRASYLIMKIFSNFIYFFLLMLT